MSLAAGRATPRMVPKVWLYTKDLMTIRVVQRDGEAESEVLVFGAEGLRRQQRFATADEAAKYQQMLEAEILGRGYTLSWGGSGKPS